jgi:hypothetical protein
VLALCAFALIGFLKPGGASPNVRPFVPLILVTVALVLLALSHQVAWGDRVVLEIPLRGKLLDWIAALRASGRLMWVAMYALTFAAAAIVAARYAPRMATMIIVGCVAVQLVDLSPRFLAMRGYFHDRFVVAPAARQSPLTSPFWTEAAKTYKTLRTAPVQNMARGWEWLALYAVDHGMAINTGQFARVSFPRIAIANDAIAKKTRRRRPRCRHAVPAVVEGDEARLRRRTRRRHRRHRRLPRDRAALVRRAARPDRPRLSRARSAQGDRSLALALPEFLLHPELLDLARQRVAAPAEPLGGVHAVAAGVHERTTDQRPLELALEPVADRFLAARERGGELAIENLLPPRLAGTRARRQRRLAHLGRQVDGLDALPRCHHGEPVAHVLELAHVAGERELLKRLERVVGQHLRLDGELARALLHEVRASGGMSSMRSRSGGRRSRTTLSRCKQVLAEQSLPTRSSRFWCVAAITRTFDLSGAWPPTR